MEMLITMLPHSCNSNTLVCVAATVKAHPQPRPHSLMTYQQAAARASSANSCQQQQAYFWKLHMLTGLQRFDCQVRLRQRNRQKQLFQFNPSSSCM